MSPPPRTGGRVLAVLALICAMAVTSCGGDSPTGSGSFLPRVSSIEPDTILAGESVRLVLLGDNLEDGQIAYWTDYEFPVHESRVWGFFVDLPVWAVLVAPGAYELSVASSETATRASDPVEVVVLDREPSIRSLSPASAMSGSGPTTLTVTGRFLAEGSQLAWNGETRPTERVDASTLRIDLAASDLETPGTPRVTITKEGTGDSRPVGFPILSADPPTISSLQTLALESVDLVADPVRDLVYALVPPSAPAYGGEFVAIDPFTATVEWSTPIGEATHAVVSDDGSYAYAALSTVRVARVDLAGRTVDITISMPGETLEVRDIVPIPGMPRRIAVSMSRGSSNPRQPTVAIFDDGSMRVDQVGGFEDMDRLEPSTRSTRIYAYGSGELRTLAVLQNGITIWERAAVGYYEGLGTEMIHDNGWLFGDNGRVVDADAAVPVGRFPVAGPVRPDAANGRVHFLVGDELKTMHVLTYAEIGTLGVPEAAGSTVAVRFGDDGLAFGGGDGVVLLRSELIGG